MGAVSKNGPSSGAAPGAWHRRSGTSIQRPRDEVFQMSGCRSLYTLQA